MKTLIQVTDAELGRLFHLFVQTTNNWRLDAGDSLAYLNKNIGMLWAVMNQIKM